MIRKKHINFSFPILNIETIKLIDKSMFIENNNILLYDEYIKDMSKLYNIPLNSVDSFFSNPNYHFFLTKQTIPLLPEYSYTFSELYFEIVNYVENLIILDCPYYKIHSFHVEYSSQLPLSVKSVFTQLDTILNGHAQIKDFIHNIEKNTIQNEILNREFQFQTKEMSNFSHDLKKMHN